MSPLRPVCLLVLVAMIGTVSCLGGTPCTPATCVDGPIIIFFSSTDCSGAGSLYNYIDDDPSTYGSCRVHSGTYFHRLDVLNDFVVYTEVNNPSCDVTLSNATYNIQQDYFGKCRPLNELKRGMKDGNLESTSWMVLANPNATYTSPQPAPVVNLNYPDIYTDAYGRYCRSPTNCTSDSGEDPLFIIYITPSDSCTPSSASATYNNSFDGTCYRAGDLFYASQHCTDEHGFAIFYYLDSACQNVFSAVYSRETCVAGVSSNFYACLAAPIPLAPFASPSATPSAVPTSAANSILPSFLLLLASLMAFLF